MDSTVFIRIDFPILLNNEKIHFLTTPDVIDELKDFRSKSNFDLLKQSDKITITTPMLQTLKKVKEQISKVDPRTKLSPADISVLALAFEKECNLVSHDLALQNGASLLKVPIKLFSGKRIRNTYTWSLKCKSCGHLESNSYNNCQNCGGILKRIKKKANR